MQGDAVKHNDVDPSLRKQAGDGVEGIDLGSPRRYLRQIPSDRRSRRSDPPLDIKHSPSLDDSTDRSHRWRIDDSAFKQCQANRYRTVIAKVAGLCQFVANSQNPAFDVPFGAVRCTPNTRRSCAPVDAVQTSAIRPLNPPLYHRKRDVARSCYLAQGRAGANTFDHRPTMPFDNGSCHQGP